VQDSMSLGFGEVRPDQARLGAGETLRREGPTARAPSQSIRASDER
jgi:hypothetical protein